MEERDFFLNFIQKFFDILTLQIHPCDMESRFFLQLNYDASNIFMVDFHSQTGRRLNSLIFVLI